VLFKSPVGKMNGGKTIGSIFSCLTARCYGYYDSYCGTLSSQEVGGTIIGEDGLVVMAGAESVEWYQTHQTHGLMPFHVLRSSHYYEPSSPQQSPLSYSLDFEEYDKYLTDLRTVLRYQYTM
jgi:hypothetical protein